ncbi:hypothetical protein Naga_100042g31 [Nannochloropsis gaditana]|uniref:Uncharacterized protein n=1 Tax=Nannochloropsis gaditana TaxID=72520 RepID=W7U9D0_9STRA|nr:hypothetical protein Naga_100042g31 [Nannochloropsis gaditana]
MENFRTTVYSLVKEWSDTQGVDPNVVLMSAGAATLLGLGLMASHACGGSNGSKKRGGHKHKKGKSKKTEGMGGNGAGASKPLPPPRHQAQQPSKAGATKSVQGKAKKQSVPTPASGAPAAAMAAARNGVHPDPGGEVGKNKKKKNKHKKKGALEEGATGGGNSSSQAKEPSMGGRQAQGEAGLANSTFVYNNDRGTVEEVGKGGWR